MVRLSERRLPLVEQEDHLPRARTKPPRLRDSYYSCLQPSLAAHSRLGYHHVCELSTDEWKTETLGHRLRLTRVLTLILYCS